MEKFKYPRETDWNNLLKRPTQTVSDIEATVSEIFKEIQYKGDQAVAKYTHLFDGITLSDFKASQRELEDATIPSQLAEAIQLAKSNIESFHKAQQTETVKVTTMPGVQCWQEKRPIQKIGLYIPGGSAPLFSTILMLAVPARIAGCKEIVLCTPPDENGTIDSAILYTAALCGITDVYKIGGIQAIAAMTFGTESVPKVFKIFGPGNQFVTVAKQLSTKFNVAIDMPAGPSELLVYADDSANPAFMASDLLSQAEHGPDSQVVLVTTSEVLLEQVSSEVQKQLILLPRKEIADKAIKNSKMILVRSEKEAIKLINQYAPEHFIVVSENEDYFLNNIQNAGSVFVGNFTPESAGDYASGTNHTLPTNGYAKQYSGVNLDSFMKSMTFQRISDKGMASIGPAIEVMADAEGLQAHKNAVSIRLEYLNNPSND